MTGRIKRIRKSFFILVAGTVLLGTCGCESGNKETTAVNESTLETAFEAESSESFETFETDEFEERKASSSGNLERTMAYIESVDMEKYTEASWNEFVQIYSEIYTEYMDGASDERCDELQRELETAKCRLQFRMSEDEGKPLVFRELSVEDMVADMGTGWNLGNTMDGHSGFTPNETIWQSDITTQSLIDAIHDYGFHTIRIPVTWGTMIADDYSINDKWISRVQDIVDYCMNQDMYVIINIHHDGADHAGWLNISAEDIDLVYEKYEEVWRNIANRFRDYDEHLIFESMNEVYGEGSDVNNDTRTIMNMNQIFVNVVRSTGSNNAIRWLSVPGRYTNIEHMTNEKYGFEMPEDTVENRLFASVHYYDYSFGMEESMTKTSFDASKVNALEKECKKLIDRFTSRSIPVIMGEYGAVNKNNPTQRAYHNEVFNYLLKQAGVVPVYWDQGWYDRSKTPADYSFSLVDRVTGQSIDKEVTDALMRGYFADGALSSVSEIEMDSDIIPIEGLETDTEEIQITVGDDFSIPYTALPENTNDVLLWKSSDTGIATVYNGIVRAKGIGRTTVTAYSQSGSMEKEFSVYVVPMMTEAAASEIYFADETVVLATGSYVFLEPELVTDDEKVYLYYRSMDPTVATVSKTGKLTAVSEGETTIVMTATDGTEITVSVLVEEVVSEQILHLALNVLYNDEENSYYGNEVGASIEVTTDGEYTLSFDCAGDLSQAAVSAGVSGLNNLTAIYIKDNGVTNGDKKKSGLVSCDIVYNQIIVDGVELTLKSMEPKSAIKTSGILDTNDPFNSWDGSVVEEVVEKSHVLNMKIDGIDNPQTVTVVFTLSNLVFEE